MFVCAFCVFVVFVSVCCIFRAFLQESVAQKFQVLTFHQQNCFRHFNTGVKTRGHSVKQTPSKVTRKHGFSHCFLDLLRNIIKNFILSHGDGDPGALKMSMFTGFPALMVDGTFVFVFVVTFVSV